MPKAIVPFKTSSRKIVLPKGGIKGLQKDEIFDSYEEWAQGVIRKFKVTKNNVMPMFFIFLPHLAHNYLLEFLKYIIKIRMIDKYELIRLYKHQSLKTSSPFLELQEIATFCIGDKPILSKKEIMRVAREVVYISSKDIAFLLSHNEYRSLVSLELLESWIVSDYLNSLTAALVAKYLVKMGSKTITLDVIEARISHSANRSPENGTINIYLEILYEVNAKLGKRKSNRPRQIFAEVINELIRPTADNKPVLFSEAKKLLTWYLANPLIGEEDRNWVETEIEDKCKLWVEMYGNFVKSAKERSPFVVKRVYDYK